ncbi:uncharacterized protein LOC133907065 isoform X1 [Phragmites australis]|uniref:uncharacterized protein LOC133907065 isoform X1 n=1 Tax=Phragmites australis TaxID=29695 RepID=UPI002D79DFA6|nr:uncharacterized protein LOC133907065 isoform X1 [Phragmites australis]XP_062205046.1 uncharacterized protein LOC133907065 isoform X1 [Phragmites australis]XP_062205047.1 uncharacterized protein LOC133907065 isoform X1 [Phragmites australis]XP_062205048.1 uncharacterized protein LOC133907065 isoform X1 [Phragmites australis]XP_062205050.1 uncharacterized protein LOC133907065 isoform X1 [Phragmites australis]XP_062205051.1 uncharacterized protein LOC133907065 isoform X1 [Phragmites australis]
MVLRRMLCNCSSHCSSGFDLLAQQLPTFEEVQSGQATLESWDEQYKKLHASLRNANLQAKENIRKAAQEEFEMPSPPTLQRRALAISSQFAEEEEGRTIASELGSPLLAGLLPMDLSLLLPNADDKT